MIRALALAAGVALCAAAPAGAATMDRVRGDGVVRCGGVIRPGLAFPAADQTWQGLEVDLCRAVAVAVLGANAKIEFHSYFTDKDFARLASGADDLAFLTGSEIHANNMFGAVLPGPAVFYETTRLMVQEDNPARHVADLRDTRICAEPGTGPERNLQEYMARNAIPFRQSMWQEVEEMMDAFNVGRCPAVAGEETALAALRLDSEAEGHPARVLPEPLAAAPISIATPAGDPAWAAVAHWTVQTVLTAERSPRVQGPRLPVPAPPLGLQPGWQDRVIEAVGTYPEAFNRSLGAGSPLELPPGLNARWDGGGLFAPPAVE